MMNVIRCMPFFFTLLLTSCVGTIEEKNPDTTKNTKSSEVPVEFNGIIDAVAISHDKVELYFFPASGNPENLVYLIYINNGKTPLEVKANAFFTTTEGAYVYTVKDLRLNTTYSFSVGVKNLSTGFKSTVNSSLFATTFVNKTADFEGITSAVAVTGQAGQTQIELKWIPATIVGSALAKSEDPVAYEVRYMRKSAGKPELLLNKNNSVVTSAQQPSSLSSTPPVNRDDSRIVAGLEPDTEYYFLVRAIHKDYIGNETNTLYKLEENTKILEAKTLDADGLFSWNEQTVSFSTPLGELGKTKLDIRWEKASGPFVEYRVYREKVGDANVDPNSITNTLTDAEVDSMNATNSYDIVSSADISFRASSLDSFAYYAFRVAACQDNACGASTRVLSASTQIRILPLTAPFNGLLSIGNPNDSSQTNRITLNFDSPVVSAGYIDELRVYCYQNVNDETPTLLNPNVQSSSADTQCDQLTRITAEKTSQAGFSNFTQIVIEGDFIPGQDTISAEPFCFSMVPVVTGTNYLFEDLDNAVIKCQNIELKTPSIVEFPGLDASCSVDTSSATVTWSSPTGGLFEKFELFYKEADGEPFSFNDAKDHANNNYISIDNINANASTNTLNSLTPGKLYLLGILTYLEKADGSRAYSEVNSQITNCRTKFPKPSFDEWIDIFAIGAKTDGRVSRQNGTGAKTYIAETLNAYFQPIEVELDGPDGAPTLDFENQYGTIAGALAFDGIYNENGYAYSNSGVVRIVWRDIYFEGDTNDRMFDYTNNTGSGYAEEETVKKDRKFGYRVYRSTDGGLNWKDLTSKDTTGQSASNEGLIYPVDFSERDRSNAGVNTFKVGSFTDYSVEQLADLGETARARELLYKVVPVFDGVELEFERADTNPQNIIKVLLPPANMALVNRLMANRQTCKEVGKTYTKDLRLFYSCPYNGLGARSLSKPWVVGATVYDLGGDLLMDRFELGCDYTRGDKAHQDSYSANNLTSFDGMSTEGNRFKGCFLGSQRSGAQNVSNTQGNHPQGAAQYDSYNQFMVGDCIGASEITLSNRSTTCNSNEEDSEYYTYSFPGAAGSFSCQDEGGLASNYFEPYTYDGGGNVTGTSTTGAIRDMAQSENLAVFYNRRKVSSTQFTRYLRGAENKKIEDDRINSYDRFRYPSSCSVNMPVKDNVSGNIYSRWVPINFLNNLVHDGNSFNLLNSTVNDIENSSYMYDSNNNALLDPNLRSSPNLRYTGDTPIAKVFSSNDAKLPPLDGLSQGEYNQVCQAYKVEVGQLSDDGNYLTVKQEKSKRIMRRTEGIVASAYPKEFSSAKIESMERGEAGQRETPVTSGTDSYGMCNTFERAIVNAQRENDIESGTSMLTAYPDAGLYTNSATKRPVLLTGSSFYDEPGAHTENCTSRYGVHDLVGNISEYSSENFACDFSAEEIYLGPTNSLATSIRYADIGSNFFLQGALVAWTQIITDPDPNDPNNVIARKTGRCSVVQAGSNREESGLAFLANDNQTMNPVYDDFGNLNTNLVQVQTGIDQENLEFLRSGDGYFMDFGNSNFLPALTINDTLSLVYEASDPNDLRTNAVRSRAIAGGASNDPRKGKYFNPVVGMPISCGDNSCTSSTQDNMNITIGPFQSLIAGFDPNNFVVSDFPIGNSQIYSDGMSEIVETVRRVSNGDLSPNFFNYVESVDTNGTSGDFTDDSFTTYSDNNSGSLKSTGDNDGTTAVDAGYIFSRGQASYFLNFGSSKTVGSGRYTAEQQARSEYAQGINIYSGTRCAIKFGDD